MTKPLLSPKNIRRRKDIGLILTVLVSITCLIVANYFTLEVSHAIRGYVSGESIYSRHEKSAAINLMMYVKTANQNYYTKFKADIAVPDADNHALKRMLEGENEADMRKYLLEAGNSPEDVGSMIWLFQSFRGFDFMLKSIDTWMSAGEDIDAYIVLGDEISSVYSNPAIVPAEEAKMEYLFQIDQLASRINDKEHAFSKNLSATAIRNGSALFWINIVLIVIIFGSIALLYRRVIRGFMAFQNELKNKNRGLLDTNRKLDQFIYATSHDLKAPVNNIQGLANIAAMDPAGISKFQEEVFTKIHISIETLTETLEDIENLVRLEKQPFDDFEQIDIHNMIDEILLESHIIEDIGEFEIKNQLDANSFYFSRRGMRSILSNLLFNAVKYRRKDQKLRIEITSQEVNNVLILRITDNGMGIDMEKHGEHIFDLFRRFHHNVPGAGLGLYSIKRIVDRNGGSIKVVSDLNRGSDFTVRLLKTNPDTELDLI